MSDLLAEIRANQRAEWQAGRRVPIQTYLEQHPQLAEDEDGAIDLIYSEILLREELGEAVDWDEYLHAYPRFAEKLRRQQAVHDMMKGLSASDAQRTAPLTAEIETEHNLGLPEFPVVAGYQIESVLGEGSFGIVYLARQLSLDKLVALKMLRANGLGQPEKRMLLRRDAEVLAKLDHPNIVRIIDFGESGGRSFYSMEYVKGRSLEERLKAGRLPPREAAQLVETLARALHAVHEQQIVHRDLKPANILLDEHGTLKVADFGLAKRIGGGASLAARGLVGNFAHMAPEQTEDTPSDVGPRTDIWALGVILYECLTGASPFTGGTRAEAIRAIRTAEPPSFGSFRIPRDLQAICLKYLEKKVVHRFASAVELAEELGRFLRQDPRDPVRTRPRAWPIQTWRLARRHPVLAGVIILAVATMVIVSTVRFLIDPNRRIAWIESQIAKGNAVTLISDEGKSGWYDIRTGADATQISQARDGAFSVHSWGFCLVVLVREVRQSNYKIRAQIRHERGQQPGEVGLFFCLEEIATDAGTVLTFGQVAFDDYNREADINRMRPPGLPGPLPEPDGNPIYIEPFVYGLRADGTERTQRLNSGSPTFRFEPVKGGNRWHWLTIDVSTTGIIAYWDDDEWIGMINAVEWKSFLTIGLSNDRLINRSDSPGLARHGALGLYVTRSTASFRNVVVEPR
jgi:serine/threonine-protein kinase